MIQGKCPDCPKGQRHVSQVLYECPDGVNRCMSCRAKFRQGAKAETENTRRADTADRASAKPVRHNAQPHQKATDAELTDALKNSKTMKEAMDKTGLKDSPIRKRAKRLGIPLPGGRKKTGPKSNVTDEEFRGFAATVSTTAILAEQAGMTPSGTRHRCHRMGIPLPGQAFPEPAAEEVTAEPDAPAVDEEQACDPATVPREFEVITYAEVWADHNDLKLCVRHDTGENGAQDHIAVCMGEDVIVEKYPGMWRKVARMILEHEKVEAGG